MDFWFTTGKPLFPLIRFLEWGHLAGTLSNQALSPGKSAFALYDCGLGFSRNRPRATKLLPLQDGIGEE